MKFHENPSEKEFHADGQTDTMKLYCEIGYKRCKTQGLWFLDFCATLWYCRDISLELYLTFLNFTRMSSP